MKHTGNRQLAYKRDASRCTSRRRKLQHQSGLLHLRYHTCGTISFESAVVVDVINMYITKKHYEAMLLAVLV